MSKPSLPKGTRDFSPQEMVKRNHIFDTIKAVFKKYGYAEIQTPSMENSNTLLGKYGDEGDKLIFKVLESGEFSNSTIENLLSRFNDLNNDELCLEIAKEWAHHIASSISIIKGLKKVEIKKYFLETLKTEFFKNINDRFDYSLDVKKIFINNLFGKSTRTPLRNFQSRLDYYFSIPSDSLVSEILRSFKLLIKNSTSLKVLLNLQFVSNEVSNSLNSKRISADFSKKALRYDLTVPFARYVVMHQNEISFPFKRFQIQPVWRADRPQKGRYREFYQCDADVVGSPSLLNEAEFILIYREALQNLGLKDFTIKINNRKILSGIAEIIGKPELIVDMTVAIDKLDKIGLDGVSKELIERGFTELDIEKLKPVILLEGSNLAKLESLKVVLAQSPIGLTGIEEIETVFDYLAGLTSSSENLPSCIELDITLARGLNYYTGCIFEVKTNEVAMGSIGGGGRYDDLTGMFGLKDLTGVGISFGADRIYDVLEELDLFPAAAAQGTKVLISNFDTTAERYALPILQQLRGANIPAEIYPTAAKLKKQLGYADDKKIPYVLLIGDNEMHSGQLTLKDMQSGNQQQATLAEIIALIS